MTNGSPPRLGKTHRQENFPVASLLIRARHRPVILAFYRFARTADDVADRPDVTPEQKIDRLDAMEASLLGEGAQSPEGLELHRALGAFGLSPRHAQDLLKAFRLDATKRRYADWGELMEYCANSAMPVGRFVLDVHGEDPSTWPASDAVCAALQIINHLQDCGEDFRHMDRVYLPLETLAAHGADVSALGANHASAPLLASIRELAGRAAQLLRDGAGLAPEIADWRLGLEISAIHALAFRITGLLEVRDPLSQGTHLNKWQAGGTALIAILRTATHGFGLTPRSMAPGVRL